MYSFRILLLLALFPCLLNAQQAVFNLGIGGTSSLGTSLPYEPTYHASATLSIRRLMVQAGGWALNDNSTGLIHGYYGTFGITTKVKRIISIHLTAGVKQTEPVKDIAPNTIGNLSALLNGGFFLRPRPKKRFTIGGEAFLWQKVIHEPQAKISDIKFSVVLTVGFKIGR